MVIATLPPSLPEPEDEYTKKLKKIIYLCLDKVKKQPPIQEAAEQTIVEMIAAILSEQQVTASAGMLEFLAKRLRRFAIQQTLLKPAPAVSPAETNPIAHLSPDLQAKI